MRLLVWVFIFLNIIFSPKISSADGIRVLSFSKVQALMFASFYYTDLLHASNSSIKSLQAISSIQPKQLGLERLAITEFARSLIYEGGFYPLEIARILGVKDINNFRVARITKQLDKQTGSMSHVGWSQNQPLVYDPDIWSMSPGETEGVVFNTSGLLAYLPSLGIAYYYYPESAQIAAKRLAVFIDDDLRAEATAKAAVRLIIEALRAEKIEKDNWLKQAAAASEDEEVELFLRSVRVKDWSYLRGEESSLGRLERVLSIWYNTHSFNSALALGREKLQSTESLLYLSALAAATYDANSLPSKLLTKAVEDNKLVELVEDLYDLGTAEAVILTPDID